MSFSVVFGQWSEKDRLIDTCANLLKYIKMVLLNYNSHRKNVSKSDIICIFAKNLQV